MSVRKRHKIDSRKYEWSIVFEIIDKCDITSLSSLTARDDMIINGYFEHVNSVGGYAVATGNLFMLGYLFYRGLDLNQDHHNLENNLVLCRKYVTYPEICRLIEEEYPEAVFNLKGGRHSPVNVIRQMYISGQSFSYELITQCLIEKIKTCLKQVSPLGSDDGFNGRLSELQVYSSWLRTHCNIKDGAFKYYSYSELYKTHDEIIKEGDN